MSRQDRQGVRTAADLERKYDQGGMRREVAASETKIYNTNMNVAGLARDVAGIKAAQEEQGEAIGEVQAWQEEQEESFGRTEEAAGAAESSAAEAAASANASAVSAAEAAASGKAAEDAAVLSRSYAVGGTGTREGEDTDNAKYYSEQAGNAEGGGVTLEQVYPVGSIYMSVDSTSPAELFGGTWEQLEDTFLLAAGSSYSAGSTGGEETHTLTVSEMPAHNHDANTAYWYPALNDGTTYGHPTSGGWNFTNASNVVNVSAAGGGTAHNNMPPYLAVYMWKRTE